MCNKVANHAGDSGIVYCLSRKKVEDLSAWLGEQAIAALPYHAGLSQDIRQTNQHRFIHEDGLIIVATIAFGMGIDKPDVRFVVHMDLPKSLEAYYQETGRAGRDGLPANAVMFYGLKDLAIVSHLIETSESPDEIKRVERQKLSALLGYCETSRCRRAVLLEYFADHLQGCNNCDTCLEPVESWDGTTHAQMALSAVVRTKELFGSAYIIDLLRGKALERIRKFRHDKLPTFGVGKDTPASEWRSILRQMVAGGLLRVDMEKYGSLKLTSESWPCLKGNRSVSFRRDKQLSTQRKERKSSAPAKHAFGPNSPEERLFNTLRRCRQELARIEKVPPYIIFNDVTLIEMVRKHPQTLEEFSALTGVGAVKLERYGEIFLNLVTDARDKE